MGIHDDVTLHGSVFARCVGHLTQTGTWLFEVDRSFAHEEWSDPVQFRFVLKPGSYPQMETRLVSAAREITVGVGIDPDQLAALRLLLSQAGFALDNYLLASTGTKTDEATAE